MLSTLLLCLCWLKKSINGSTQSIMNVHHKTNRPNCRKFLLPAVCLVAYELSINKQQLCKMWTTTLQGVPRWWTSQLDITQLSVTSWSLSLVWLVTAPIPCDGYERFNVSHFQSTLDPNQFGWNGRVQCIIIRKQLKCPVLFGYNNITSNFHLTFVSLENVLIRIGL